jgi:hypothetical protein
LSKEKQEAIPIASCFLSIPASLPSCSSANSLLAISPFVIQEETIWQNSSNPDEIISSNYLVYLTIHPAGKPPLQLEGFYCVKQKGFPIFVIPEETI